VRSGSCRGNFGRCPGWRPKRLPRAFADALSGGAPVDGERHIWWNFVSSSKDRIEQAKEDWKEGRFPKVPGDTTAKAHLPGPQNPAWCHLYFAQGCHF
jgi:hypothetical protein